MALLEFFPGAAGAWGVTLDLAPCFGIVLIKGAAFDRKRRYIFSCFSLRRSLSHGSGGIGAAFLHFGFGLRGHQTGNHQTRAARFDVQFDETEGHGYGFTHHVKHSFKKLEGFGLVFIQRVALAKGAQINALTQVVKIEQMFFPVLIEHLQKNHFFNTAPDFRRRVHCLFRHFLVGGINQAIHDFGIRNSFLFRPVAKGRVNVEQADDIIFQRIYIPLFSISMLGDAAGDNLLDRLVAHVADHFLNAFDFHDFPALVVNDFALVVHHVVEFQQVFTDFEMHALDLALRTFEHF